MSEHFMHSKQLRIVYTLMYTYTVAIHRALSRIPSVRGGVRDLLVCLILEGGGGMMVNVNML